MQHWAATAPLGAPKGGGAPKGRASAKKARSAKTSINGNMFGHASFSHNHLPESLDVLMAFTRKRRAYRKRTARRYGRRKSYGTARTASRALALARKATRVLRGNREVWETANSVTLIGAPTLNVYPLNVNEVGDGEGDRDGEQLMGSSLHIRARMYWSSSPDTFPSARMVRVLVFVQKRSPDGGSSTITPQMLFDESGLASNQVHLAIYNRATIGDFIILYDRVWTINSDDPIVLRDLKFKTPYRSTYKSVGLSGDSIYQNKICIAFIACGEIVFGTSGGTAAVEYKSSFVYYR